MARFTDSEQQLLAKVTNSRLRTSLAKIREAMEDIWASDAPRIIQDYTDHGENHCERLAGFAVKLLEANNGPALTDQETYLLLAGIYLHDIGMQCDVAKHPAIKARAEELGAQFEVDFKAETANTYSADEQKAIRKNHQYLSIAWIDHASRSGETVLGAAAKTIPDDLIDDLMDVCKHHTKLPITDCAIGFKLDPSQRKQLVAAVLRFSDELDIDSNRVSIQTVKTFSLNSQNSVYWWLHQQTKIVFNPSNVIHVTVRLNPKDAKQHGSFIHSVFIDEFQTKNRSVLSVLVQNVISVTISPDSKVVEDDRVDAFPREINEALKKLQQRHDPLMELADEVRTWLRAIRYEVSEPKPQNDRVVDMVATLEQGAVKQRVLVRCIDGEIESSDVDELDNVLDRKTPQGWLISDQRVSQQARERAAADDAFEVFNLADFLRLKIWRSYFDALTALVEENRIPDLYVDFGCYKQETDKQGHEKPRKEYTSVDEYIDKWLTERGKRQLSLLGEFGAGKTWFCRHYAHRQLKRYLNDPAKQRLPLLITLRHFAKAMDAQQLINDALYEQYKLQFVGSAYDVFQEMNRRGKLLLILDGFDEMARQVDFDTVVNNFEKLSELAIEGSKVILTRRTEHFRGAKESETILGGEALSQRVRELHSPSFEVLYLKPFNTDQIRDVIMRRLGSEEGPRMADHILDNPNLAEMARKPVLIELLLAALGEVRADELENQAQVYLYATTKLLLRNIESGRTFTTTASKLYFLCELAWDMIGHNEVRLKVDQSGLRETNPGLRVHYTDIHKRIKEYFGDQIKDQHTQDIWDSDLRGQTLLHRDVAGYYEFAHKSLAEYFVALKFAVELGCLHPLFAQTYHEAEGQACDIPIKQKDLTRLAPTFGAKILKNYQMKVVRDFLGEMLSEGASQQLWEVVRQTKGTSFEEVGYSGGNAVTLLKMKGETIERADLTETVLAGADLTRCQLSATELRGCDLRDADLSESRFNQETMNSVKLRQTAITIFGVSKRYRKALSDTGQADEQRKLLRLLSDILDQERIFALLSGMSEYSNYNKQIFLYIEVLSDDLSFWEEQKSRLLSRGLFRYLAIYDNEIEQMLQGTPVSDIRLLDKVLPLKQANEPQKPTHARTPRKRNSAATRQSKRNY
ncbi:MAG: pentapeptide repeat-containing protein [Abitibacteriaceae bacterium]|nr:pentapeptide repeat-containing protein [Abditibacteriaceae bacterium]